MLDSGDDDGLKRLKEINEIIRRMAGSLLWLFHSFIKVPHARIV